MNSLTITGNLGKDSETRFLPDGKSVVYFSVADSKGKDQGAIWWNCSWFGDRAQKVQPYLVKGQQVTVVGSVTEREWNDKEGVKHKSMDVRVNDLALQGGRKDAAPTPYQAAPMSQREPAPPPAVSGFDDMDSDIPL